MEKNGVQLWPEIVSQDRYVHGGQFRVVQLILILISLDFNVLDFTTSIVLMNAV